MRSRAQIPADKAAALADIAAAQLATFSAGRLKGSEINADPSKQRALLIKAVSATTEALAELDGLPWTEVHSSRISHLQAESASRRASIDLKMLKKMEYEIDHPLQIWRYFLVLSVFVGGCLAVGVLFGKLAF